MHAPRFGILATTLALSLPSALFAQFAAVTEPKDDLRLPLTVSGRVATVHVKPGDKVKKDDVLLQLDDRAGAAQVELYRQRAESTLAIEAAEKELGLTTLEEGRVREAFEKMAAGKFEVDRAELQSNLAKLRLDQAKEQRLQAQLQLDAARIAHDSYSLKAPIDGVIEDVVVSPGETAETLKPVVRLVSINPLVIKAHVPTPETANLAPGSSAWVLPRDASGGIPPTAAEGKIVHIAQVADARSDTREVRIELPNPAGKPAGTHVSVSFTAPQRASAQRPTEQ